MEKKPNQLLDKLLEDQHQLSKTKVFELSIYNPAEAADDLKIDDSATEQQFFESAKSGTQRKTPKETTLKKVSAEEGDMIRSKVKQQRPPENPGSNIVDSLALSMNDKRLKIGITRDVNIYEQSLPQEALDFIERHTGMKDGLTDSTNLTIYPHPTKQDTSYLCVTGCKIGEMISYLVYRQTKSPGGLKLEKVGEVIEGTKCSGYFSWHQELHPTEVGLLFFKAKGENKNEDDDVLGPFTISVELFEYETEAVTTLKEFAYGADDQQLSFIYLPETLKKASIPCATKDDLIEILDKSYLFFSGQKGEDDVMEAVLLGQPEDILYTGENRPYFYWQPIVLDIGPDDPGCQDGQSKRVHFWRGKLEGDDHENFGMLLEVKEDGTLEEADDEELKNYFLKTTEHMTKDVRNSQEPAYRGHMYFEDGKDSYYECTQDYSRFENAQFANNVVQFLSAKGQMACLLRKDSMIIIRKNSGLLYTIDFEKSFYEKEILETQPPLNALYQSHQHVVPTHYRNVAISMKDEGYYVNIYSNSLKKWESVEVTDIEDEQRKVLQPFLKNIYHQVWELSPEYNDIDGVNFSFRGGNLGSYEQLHIDLNKTQAKLDEDVECLYSSDKDGISSKTDIQIGRTRFLEQALPVEFLKYQKATDDSAKPVFALTHMCKQEQTVHRYRKFANKVIDIENIIFTVITKNKTGKRDVISQYRIPLVYKEHKVHGTEPLAALREHHSWDFCPISEWMKVETTDGLMNQIDHAFCEFQDESNLIEVKILRFQSEGTDHKNPRVYQVGSKLLMFKESYSNKDVALQPTFDESNRITGCQLRHDRGEEEEAVHYPFNTPTGESTIFDNALTNQTYTIFRGERNNPTVCLIEVEFTRLLQKDHMIFSENQKRDILRSLVGVMVDMVPHKFPQNIKKEVAIRQFSNYESLKGHKPYCFRGYTPNEFSNALDEHEIGHKTLADIMFGKEHDAKDTLEGWGLYFSKYPLNKRNSDGQTLLKSFYAREDKQIIKLMSATLLECTEEWQARDTIMSDLYEMFKSSDMLVNWEGFFTNTGDVDDVTCPKWQMGERCCDFLTTGDQQQLYHVQHSQDLMVGPRRYFTNFCHRYDHDKDNNQYSIQPVLIDLELPEQSMTMQNFQEGEKPTRINDLQMADWMDKLIEQFPDQIEDLTFTKEWNEVMFERVRGFYYRQFAIYFVYCYCIFQLVLRDMTGNEDPWTWLEYFQVSWAIFQTAYSIMMETIQLQNAGLFDYITDPWNLVESIQIFFNLFFITTALVDYKVQKYFFAIVMLSLTMFKFLVQLRVFDQLGQMVLLVFQCVNDTLPFVIYLIIWIVFFVCVNQILGATSGDPYPNLGGNTSDYLNMFRSAIGDIQNPVFQCTDKESVGCEVLTYAIWTMFVMMVYFMPVTLNNFLIAKVSAVYETFQETATLTMNANKIALIKDYLMFQNFIGRNKDFNIICMFQNEVEGGEKPWDVAAQGIKENFTEQFQELKTDQGEMKKDIESVKAELAKVSDNIAQILEKLQQ